MQYNLFLAKKNASQCMMLFFLVILSTGLQAQTATRGVCGTVSAEDRMLIGEQLFENKRALAEGLVAERGVIKYVPIKFHIVGKSDSSGRVSESRVLDLLCGLNKNFFDQEIQFYLKGGFSYIYNDDAYNAPLEMAGENVLKSRKDPGAYNVYIANTIEEINGGVVQGIFRPSASLDFVIIIKAEVKLDAVTLTHESGHFFSLLHTFNGWDCDAYDAATHGAQVGLTSPCQGVSSPGAFNSPLVSVKNECMNGTDGNLRGDYVADTPPDYNFGSTQAGCAAITAVVKDPCGAVVQPQNNNYMSYFNGCATYQFVTGQKNIIFASYNSLKRAYIRPANPNPAPNLTVVNTAATLISPTDSLVTPTFNGINFDWEDVAGATNYIFEVSRFVTFQEDVNTIRLFTTQSKVTLAQSLTPNRRYYWRVRPYNNLNTCQPFSAVTPSKAYFITGTLSDVAEFSEQTSVSLSPNPAGAGGEVELRVTTKNDLQANITICNMAGQVLQTISEAPFAAGTSAAIISTKNFPSGIYVVTLRTNLGFVWNQKLVVQ